MYDFLRKMFLMLYSINWKLQIVAKIVWDYKKGHKKWDCNKRKKVETNFVRNIEAF